MATPTKNTSWTTRRKPKIAAFLKRMFGPAHQTQPDPSTSASAARNGPKPPPGLHNLTAIEKNSASTASLPAVRDENYPDEDLLAQQARQLKTKKRATSWCPDEVERLTASASKNDADTLGERARTFFSGDRMKSFSTRRRTQAERQSLTAKANATDGFDLTPVKEDSVSSQQLEVDQRQSSRPPTRISFRREIDSLPTAIDAGLVVGLHDGDGNSNIPFRQVSDKQTTPPLNWGEQFVQTHQSAIPQSTSDSSTSTSSPPCQSSVRQKKARPSSTRLSAQTETVSTGSKTPPSVPPAPQSQGVPIEHPTVLDENRRTSQTSLGGCPYGHGTATAISGRPQPGPICPRKCVALPAPDSSGTKLHVAAKDAARDRRRRAMLRDALEFQHQFQAHEDSTPEKATARMKEVTESILSTGIYEHSLAEIEFGVRLAWRNSSNCPARQLCGLPHSLRILDHRSIRTSQEMQARCVVHMELASVLKSKATACLSVFPPLTRQGKRGPRIWNSGLIEYAGYLMPDGEVLGNKSQIAFTGMCIDRLGWSPPYGERTAFDLLPVVIQIDAGEPPVLLDVSGTVAPQLLLSHPRFPILEQSKLKCPIVPSYSHLNLEIGGVRYPVILSRWPTDREVSSQFLDNRYMSLPVDVVLALRRSLAGEPGSWRSKALKVLNQAAAFSFEVARAGIVNHSDLVKEHLDWVSSEKQERGFVTVNLEAALAQTNLRPPCEPCYEYLIKPCFTPTPDWLEYLYPRRKSSQED